MTNIGPAAYHLHQQQGHLGHGYGNPPAGPSFPPSFPPQQYSQPQYSAQTQAAPVQHNYQQFQQQNLAYGNFNPQLNPSAGPLTSSGKCQTRGSPHSGACNRSCNWAAFPRLLQPVNLCADQSGHQAPQPIYTSTPYSQPVNPGSTPLSTSQSGPTSYSGSGSQQSQTMAAPSQPFFPNPMMQQRQVTANGALAQQAQLQNVVQNQNQALPPTNPQSQQSAARERARVTVLLDINTHLLQEVVSLQAQGKAGLPSAQTQQSPTKDSAASPTSATDPSNPLNQSPVDPLKPTGGKPPSPEYVECMRRLQANLSYLAAIADAKKKKEGTLPTGPAIMAPPPHLPDVTDLYKKLNALFPNASQSAINKAMAIASAQTARAQNPVQAHG